MTKQELLHKLESHYNDGDHDPEEAHVCADRLLLEYINDKDIEEAYNKIQKWYA